MSRLYANENFPFPTVEELRRRGHDVLTSLDAGNAGQRIPDEEVLQFSVADSRAVLTLNRRHFVRLHRLTSDHFGIVVCTYDPDFVALADRIDDTIRSSGELRTVAPNQPSQQGLSQDADAR
jgi:hypothetical protein